jgi:regulatory protein
MAGFGSRRPRKRPTEGDDEAPPLSPAEQAAASRAQALRLLERRSYSEVELTRRLQEKGDAPDVAAATVARLVEAGLVNDANYARQVARSFLVGRRASVRRVQQEMMRRGIARSLADEAVAETKVDEGIGNEDESVERAARKKVKSLSGLDPQTRARRLTAYLARRGYEMDAIQKVVRRLRTGDLEE